MAAGKRDGEGDHRTTDIGLRWDGDGAAEATVQEEFSHAIRDLEDRGVVALVVAAEVPDLHRRVCRNMQGIADTAPRRRLLAVSGVGLGPIGPRLPADTPLERCHLQVIVNELPARSAQSTERPGPEAYTEFPDVVVTRLDEADLGRFGESISDSIVLLSRCAGDEPAPQEIRVGVDGLAALIEAHGLQEVAIFTQILAHQTRSVTGFGHVHLTVERDHRWVQTIAPSCDIVVELRETEDGGEQRWRLRDGPTSDWLPID